MDKKSIDLDRARVTMIKMLAMLCFIGYFASKVKLIVLEITFILIFIGLLILLFMEKYKDNAQGIIDG